MRRLFPAVPLMAILLTALAAGCSVGPHAVSVDGAGPDGTVPATRTDGTGRPGAAVPSPLTPYSTPTPAVSPAPDASAQEQILYELESRVLIEAATPGQLSGWCDHPISGDRDQTVTCTVRYEDQRVSFRVGVGGGSTIFSFRASQRKAVITRSGVQAAYANYAYGSGVGTPPVPDSVRCDAKLPDRGLVDFDARTPYTCSYRVVGGSAAVTSTVTISADGPRF